MSETAVVASNVSYVAASVPLVSEVDLRARGTELVAICGPNGAGKSTLLGLLAGDLVPDRGSISLNGAIPTETDTTSLAKLRAVLPQSRRSDVPFSAEAVVRMGRFPYRNDKNQSNSAEGALVASAMARTDTAHLAKRVFATLSGGEQTRVALARVLAQDAPIILLDEPTAALDIAHQEFVLAELRSLATEGKCVITVLHDLNAAAHYADRIVLMGHASLQAEGTPTEVLRADLLSKLYAKEVMVIDHPTRNCPLVLVS